MKIIDKLFDYHSVAIAYGTQDKSGADYAAQNKSLCVPVRVRYKISSLLLIL